MKPNEIDEKAALHARPVIVYLISAFVVLVAIAFCVASVAVLR